MRKEKARTCWIFSRTRRLRFHLPEVENAASRNSCNTLTSMATSLCRWRCSGGERVRKKKSDIIFSFILPATENANRYYIGCCLKRSLKPNRPRLLYIIRWKRSTKTVNWLSSISPRVCSRFPEKMQPSHPSTL